MKPVRFGVATAAALCLGATLIAQQPTFRSGVDLVTVDVLIVDNDGRPIVGLERGDFAVTVDGKPRELTSAQFVATNPPPAMPAALVRDVSGNSIDLGGRLVLVVVDRTNIRQ